MSTIVAIDLRLAGEIPPKHGFLQVVKPVPAHHRLRGAWRAASARCCLVRAPLTAPTPICRSSLMRSRAVSSSLLHRSRAILRSLRARDPSAC
jgi:hypothetical protein